jgi:hypothetical protein
VFWVLLHWPWAPEPEPLKVQVPGVLQVVAVAARAAALPHEFRPEPVQWMVSPASGPQRVEVSSLEFGW